MPLFFFHLRGDISRPDLTGVDLNGIDEAWTEAVQFAKDLQAEPGSMFNGRQWSLHVNDHTGRFLFQLDFDHTG